MRILLFKSFSALIILASSSLVVLGGPSSAELSKMLPNDVGAFHQLPSIRPLVTLAREGLLNPSAFRVSNDQAKSPFIGAEVEYLSPSGQRLLVEIVRVMGDSDAYSFLTLIARKMSEGDPNARLNLGEVGTASVKSDRSVAFFRGSTILRITRTDPDPKGSEDLLVLARLFADKLDKGGNEIPVLVKHLPDWLTAQQRAIYAVNHETLVNTLDGQPIIRDISFEGGVEAVTSNYGSTQLALIEFTTPQLAGENDRIITARIQDLRGQGQPVPSAYRRVGNYSVFVFNAANEQAANELINQVKYEQVVQWLGDNPHLLEKATREYYETTAGVLVAVVKASGLSLLACFAVGGFLGALLFSRRRAQQRDTEAFSDAGGMLRLNIDEMTPETDPAKLLGRGN